MQTGWILDNEFDYQLDRHCSKTKSKAGKTFDCLITS